MAVADVRKPLVKDLHEHIVCPLCRGYLIDATTLVECLHSFCRGCIVRRLGSGARACPVCGAVTLPPLLPDFALQRLVYLAVPGLYRSELDRRRHFRSVNPQCPPPAPPLGGLALTLEDAVSLSLCEILNEELPPPAPVRNEEKTVRSGAIKRHENAEDYQEDPNPELNSSSNARQIRYLKCPAGVTVRHLIRLLALKRGWGDTESKLPAQPKRIEMLYQKVKGNKPEMRPLELSWTLLDLACIFKWDKETPMKLFYRVVKRGEDTMTAQTASAQLSSYNTACNPIIGSNSNVNIENVQRPPTPPPSPKQSVNQEVKAPVASPRSLHSAQLKSVSEAAICKSAKPVINNCNPEPKSKLKVKTSGEHLPEPKPPMNEAELIGDNKSVEPEESPPIIAIPSSPLPAPIPILQPASGTEAIVNCAPDVHAAGEMKVKKPRCEVTPVMRAPGPQGSGGSPGELQSNKPRKVPRLEHHKRRKRRNKRLIAEITTTPREDLLKLKVRLTPCPPRITSGAAGSAKEKLLQMRAVRREKIKSNNTCAEQRPPTPPSMPLTPPPSASAEKIPPPLIAAPITHPVKLNSTIIVEELKVQKSKPSIAAKETKDSLHHQDSQEETIEEIINGIPDEVVRVAQNMNNCQPQQKQQKQQKQQQQKPAEEAVAVKEKEIVKPTPEEPALVIQEAKKVIEVSEKPAGGSSSSSSSPSSSSSVLASSSPIAEAPKDEEVLRRLGLVAISEASKTLQDKIRGSQSGGGGSGSGGGIDYHRESLERQLRESKANRVRSLLAEKQMRDALKSIMSKSKAVKGSSNSSSSPSTGPKKGPPPLAPLTLKQGFSTPPKSAHPAQILARGSSGGTTGKNEKPLDLSSGAHNALDLSPTPSSSSSSSSSSSNPTITSTTYNSAPVKPMRSKSSGSQASVSASASASALPSTSASTVAQLQNQSKSSEHEVKKNQDLNLRTLSEAAVSLLGTSPSSPATSSEARITNSTILSGNKVALRIPQPHQRISGFGNGIKIKPNLAVRHIPNPQAFVASQYRNQRTNFFNAQQQPP